MTVRVVLADDQALVRRGFRLILEAEEATRQILADAANQTRVLILTTFERDEYVFQALQLGASGFLLKTAPPEDLVTAVRVVARGEALLSPSVTRRVIQELARQQRHVRRSPELDRLTQRELELLCLVASGATNSRLARQLFVTEQTVKFHLSNIYRKLGVANRTQASRFAYAHGLVPTALTPEADEAVESVVARAA